MRVAKVRAMKKIITVVGARPQFVKASALSSLINSDECLNETLVHSGQHFDFNMSDQFFRDLSIPEPKYKCQLELGSEASQIGNIMISLDGIFRQEKPHLVIVYGDTNTTLAASLMAAKLGFPLAHVEAGLRSFRPAMAEEINRKVSDHLSQYCFCPTLNSLKNLNSEGISKNLFMVGDIMLDVFMKTRQKLDTLKMIGELGLCDDEYYFVTLHRAENVTDHATLSRIIEALRELSFGSKKIVFAVHPRTKKMIAELALDLGRTHVVDPLSYPNTVACLVHASVVITDSGGLQKEAYFAETPCVTIRDETEWLETLENGHNRLLPPNDCNRLIDTIAEIQNSRLPQFLPIYGDGNAGEKICQHLRDILSV